MYEDILIPTAGSDAVQSVVEHTLEIAGRRNARVHILYVVDDRAFLTLDDRKTEQVMAELRDEGEGAIGDVAGAVEADGLETTTEIAKGKPSTEILDYVERADIDLVTMGTRGQEDTNNILGSTAQKVVNDATVPVMTVNLAEQ